MKIRGSSLILLSLSTLALPHSLSANSTHSKTITRGLSHIEFSCKVQDRQLDFEELKMERGRGLELRILQNPTAAPNPRCRARYGGEDLESLLKTHPPKKTEVWGASNGTMFRVSGKGYASNHLLWSRNLGLIAPLRRAGGNHFFLSDARGGHEFKISFEKCAHGDSCVQVSPSLPGAKRSLKATELMPALQRTYPTVTMVLQANMPLHGDTAYAHCSRDAQGTPQNGGDWRCLRLQRTALCARTDGSISLITTPGAYVDDLGSALRPGGNGHAECSILFNLDGGGSTQLGYRSSENDAWVLSGSKMETTEAGCSAYRPVDNYLTIVRPRQDR